MAFNYPSLSQKAILLLAVVVVGLVFIGGIIVVFQNELALNNSLFPGAQPRMVYSSLIDSSQQNEFQSALNNREMPMVRNPNSYMWVRLL